MYASDGRILTASHLLLLARLMGQYRFTRWCLLSVVCGRRRRLSGVRIAADGPAGRLPGGWAVGVNGGPVRLRPVRAPLCLTGHY